MESQLPPPLFLQPAAETSGDAVPIMNTSGTATKRQNDETGVVEKSPLTKRPRTRKTDKPTVNK